MQKQTKTDNAPWTILRLLEWTTSYFKKHGIESPRAGAEILLAHSLGLRRIDLYLRYDQPLVADELGHFKALIKRRADREPVAYIVGTKEFWSIELTVTPDVLIPRPETECLVEAALTFLPETGEADTDFQPLNVLDLGTGSGAIIMALAKERPGHFFAAADISPSALAIAAQNACNHHLEDKIAFFCADWLTSIKDSRPVFDLIVSNPPYIRSHDMAGLAPEINRYEPQKALDGGTDGLDQVRLIVAGAGNHLKPSGHLLLEIGYDQKDDVKKIVEQQGGYGRIDFISDYAGLDRVAVIGKGSREPF